MRISVSHRSPRELTHFLVDGTEILAPNDTVQYPSNRGKPRNLRRRCRQYVNFFQETYEENLFFSNIRTAALASLAWKAHQGKNCFKF